MTFESRHIGNRRGGGASMIRMIMMGAILMMLVVVLRNYGDELNADISTESPVTGEVIYWPEQYKELVHHSTFSLSYNETHEQADWVAYVLTKEDLEKPFVSRTDWFEKDEKISTGSAEHNDYRESGYSRGHLIPSGDRAWSREVNAETFYMSNISPQAYEFNGGIWRELEENIRDWAKEEGRLFIVTGPVLNDEIEEVIGENQVSVPKYFYKVILDIDEPGKKAIGFLIPNEKSDHPLEDYARSVKEIEEITQIDFFHTIFLDQKLEDSLESNFEISDWPIDPDRYNRRVHIWNQGH